MVAVSYEYGCGSGPFPRDEPGQRALAALVRYGYWVRVRYDNGQLCTFRRKA